MSLCRTALNHNDDHDEDEDEDHDGDDDDDITDVSIGACIESSCLSPEPRLYTFTFALLLWTYCKTMNVLINQ